MQSDYFLLPVLGITSPTFNRKSRAAGKEWFSSWKITPAHTLLVSGRESRTPSQSSQYIRCWQPAWSHSWVRTLPEERSEHRQKKVIKMGNCCERAGNFFGPQNNTYIRVSLPAVCFVWQIAMVILFGVFIRYDEESDEKGWREFKRSHNITSNIENDFYFRYPSKYNNRQPLRNLFFIFKCICYL